LIGWSVSGSDWARKSHGNLVARIVKTEEGE
jgi:hypothetical protein